MESRILFERLRHQRPRFAGLALRLQNLRLVEHGPKPVLVRPVAFLGLPKGLARAASLSGMDHCNKPRHSHTIPLCNCRALAASCFSPSARPFSYHACAPVLHASYSISGLPLLRGASKGVLERTVKRIAHERGHPRENPLGRISAFREGESVAEPVNENIQVRRQGKVGLIHIAKRRRGAVREQRPGPVRFWVAQRGRAEGVDVDRDCPGSNRKSSRAIGPAAVWAYHPR